MVCQITDAVLSEQEWLPGERLPNELQLAEKYAVSRNTIREAIKILNANHILVTKAHSGTYVAQDPGVDEDPFKFAEVEEKYQLMLDPVSYTHLDVYKRQVCIRLLFRGPPGSIRPYLAFAGSYRQRTGAEVPLGRSALRCAADRPEGHAGYEGHNPFPE